MSKKQPTYASPNELTLYVSDLLREARKGPDPYLFDALFMVYMQRTRETYRVERTGWNRGEPAQS